VRGRHFGTGNAHDGEGTLPSNEITCLPSTSSIETGGAHALLDSQPELVHISFRNERSKGPWSVLGSLEQSGDQGLTTRPTGHLLTLRGCRDI